MTLSHSRKDSGSLPATLSVVKEVDHHLQRLHLLRRWEQGTVRTEELNDADFLLKTAAQFHGYSTRKECPLCHRAGLREVLWMYGDNLGQRSGTARTWEEIAGICQEGLPLTVHTVEVCPQCGWNYLLVERDVVKVKEENRI